MTPHRDSNSKHLCLLLKIFFGKIGFMIIFAMGDSSSGMDIFFTRISYMLTGRHRGGSKYQPTKSSDKVFLYETMKVPPKEPMVFPIQTTMNTISMFYGWFVIALFANVMSGLYSVNDGARLIYIVILISLLCIFLLGVFHLLSRELENFRAKKPSCHNVLFLHPLCIFLALFVTKCLHSFSKDSGSREYSGLSLKRIMWDGLCLILNPSGLLTIVWGWLSWWWLIFGLLALFVSVPIFSLSLMIDANSQERREFYRGL